MSKYSITYLMKNTKANLVEIIRCLEHNYEMEKECNQRQYEMLCKCKKYVWHDLRKNPSDLPKNNGEYLVLILPPNMEYLWRMYAIVYYSDLMGICSEKHWNNGKAGSDYYENYDGRVIAWREIEPFKEET